MISYGLAVVFIILSLIIGTMLGVFIMALCNAAGNADDRMGRD